MTPLAQILADAGVQLVVGIISGAIAGVISYMLCQYLKKNLKIWRIAKIEVN